MYKIHPAFRESQLTNPTLRLFSNVLGGIQYFSLSHAHDTINIASFSRECFFFFGEMDNAHNDE